MGNNVERTNLEPTNPEAYSIKSQCIEQSSLASVTRLQVSVIIPVFNDSESLQRCLLALAKQTYARDLFEVVIVDNNSSEDIAGVVDKFARFGVVHEPKVGSYAARNRGISSSRGEVIAFTDSDCIPEPDWIENGVKALTSAPGIGQVVGKVSLIYQQSQPNSIELYDELLMGFPQQRFVEEQHYGATANVFTFRSVINKVGTFNDSLKSIGDFEWGNRVFAAGYSQVYSAEAEVAHPARSKFSQIYKKTIRITGGIQDLQKQEGSSSLSDFSRSFLHDLMPPFRFTFEIFSKPELSFKQKLDVVLLRFTFKQIRAWENLRLRFGRGDSYRG